MKMKAYTVCARAQASIFMVFWPFSRKKKSPNCWRSVNDGRKVVKSKDLRRQTKEGWPFFTNCVRNTLEKAVSICVIIPQNRKVKKIQLHVIDQSFEHNGMGISYQKKSWKALKRKRRCTLHASMVSEGFANFIPKEDRPANSRDVNPLETIWIIVDETTYKDPAPKTLDELRQWLRFAWKNVTLDTLWELVHSIPHRLEIVRKHTGGRSGYKYFRYWMLIE